MHPQYTQKTLARFWSKVDKGDDPAGCWLWTGSLISGGYGRFTIGEVGLRAHRISYELAYGPIPEGLQVLHACDERYPVDDVTYRRCCNPAHLFLGTHLDNMRDMAAKGRSARGDRHGTRLHPETVARGDRHGARLHPERHPARLYPERVLRGDDHWSRHHPEKVLRGEHHPAHLHPERQPRGEANTSARLTESQVRAILARYDEGDISQSALARQFQVSVTTVWKIVHRLRWRHL